MSQDAQWGAIWRKMGCIVTRRKPLVCQCHKQSCQTAQRQAWKLLEENHLEWWDQNWWDQIFGHNHKRYIWRGVSQAYDGRYAIPTVKHGGGSLMFWGCVSAKGTETWSRLISRLMQNVIEKYQRKICTHQTGSRDVLGYSNAIMFQNREPINLFTGDSGHLGFLATIFCC